MIFVNRTTELLSEEIVKFQNSIEGAKGKNVFKEIFTNFENQFELCVSLDYNPFNN